MVAQLYINHVIAGAYNVCELYITKGLHINHMIAGAQSPEGSRWHVPEKGRRRKNGSQTWPLQNHLSTKSPPLHINMHF